MTTQPTIIDSIPGGRAAYNTVITQVANFNRVPARLANVALWVNAAKARADAAQDYATSNRAASLSAQVQQAQAEYATVADKVADIMVGLQQAGLMDVTPDFVFNTILTGGRMLSLLATTNELETQAQSVAQTTGVTTTSPWSQYLLYGGLAYAAWFLLRKRRY